MKTHLYRINWDCVIVGMNNFVSLKFQRRQTSFSHTFVGSNWCGESLTEPAQRQVARTVASKCIYIYTNVFSALHKQQTRLVVKANKHKRFFSFKKRALACSKTWPHKARIVYLLNAWRNGKREKEKSCGQLNG